MMIGKDENGKLESSSPVLCVELIVNMQQDDGVEIKMDNERKLAAIMC